MIHAVPLQLADDSRVMPLARDITFADGVDLLADAFVRESSHLVRFSSLIQRRELQNRILGDKIANSIGTNGKLPVSVVHLSRTPIPPVDAFSNNLSELRKFLSQSNGTSSSLARVGIDGQKIFDETHEFERILSDQSELWLHDAFNFEFEHLRSSIEKLNSNEDKEQTHSKKLRSYAGRIEDAKRTIAQNSLRRGKTRSWGAKGDSFLYFNRVDPGTVLYYGGKITMHPAIRKVTPPVQLGEGSTSKFYPLRPINGQLIPISSETEYSILGRFDAYLVIGSQPKVKDTSITAHLKEVKFPFETGYTSIDVSSLPPEITFEPYVKPETFAPYYHETDDIATFMVAMEGAISVRSVHTSEPMIVPQGSAAILLPKSAFYMSAIGPAPINAMFLKPTVI